MHVDKIRPAFGREHKSWWTPYLDAFDLLCIHTIEHIIKSVVTICFIDRSVRSCRQSQQCEVNSGPTSLVKFDVAIKTRFIKCHTNFLNALDRGRELYWI